MTSCQAGLCQFLDEWALLTLLVADFTSSRDVQCRAVNPGCVERFHKRDRERHETVGAFFRR
jgi:hypothetical protein